MIALKRFLYHSNMIIFKGIYFEAEVASTLNSENYRSTVRRPLEDFNSSQTDNYGFLHKQIDGNPFAGFKATVKRQSEIYGIHALIPGGFGFLIELDLLRKVSRLKLPKHQSWSLPIVIRKKQNDQYVLVYFYYDYFQKINFSSTYFDLYINKFVGMNKNDPSNYQKFLLQENIQFISLEEYIKWNKNESRVVKENPFEKYSLTLKNIQFVEEVCTLDILPIDYLFGSILVSQNFIDVLNSAGVNNIFYRDVLAAFCENN